MTSNRFRSHGLLAALALLLGCAFLLTSYAPAEAQVRLTDIRGRTVSIEKPVRKLSIDDGRYLIALALIHPDPVSLIAAWPQDVNRLGPDTYAQFTRKSPGLASLPKVASSAGTFDVESVLAAAPDVAVVSLESGVTDAQMAQLQAAGIPVVVVDFFVKPFSNLEPSLRILGQLAGRTQQANAFIAYRAAHMKTISDRVARVAVNARPLVFLEAHAGMSGDCCNAPGRGNIGDYIDFVGGRNLGAEVIQQSFGKLNVEYVISRDPKVYIATGGPHLEKAGGLVVGPGFSDERARASLAKIAARKGIAGLSAVKAGNVHGFSHQLINSPLDIVAIETFAKWIHPEIFKDLDPKRTLNEINQRFLAIPYAASYWVDLK